MEIAWKIYDMNELKQLVHNMKTTVSVMGLNETLEPYLDVIEFEEPDNNSIKQHLNSIKEICNSAVEEAKVLLRTFK